MSESTFDQVLTSIQSLPPQSLAKLRAMLNSHGEQDQNAKQEDEESKFRRLADQWIIETEHTSSVKKACMHPAYQRIIGMGSAVVPYLLRELERNPDHWFWALNAITEADPAIAEDSFDGAIKAWLRWGKEKGYL